MNLSLSNKGRDGNGKKIGKWISKISESVSMRNRSVFILRCMWANETFLIYIIFNTPYYRRPTNLSWISIDDQSQLMVARLFRELNGNLRRPLGNAANYVGEEWIACVFMHPPNNNDLYLHLSFSWTFAGTCIKMGYMNVLRGNIVDWLKWCSFLQPSSYSVLSGLTLCDLPKFTHHANCEDSEHPNKRAHGHLHRIASWKSKSQASNFGLKVQVFIPSWVFEFAASTY